LRNTDTEKKKRITRREKKHKEENGNYDDERIQQKMNQKS
jgi:hypothetical protein